MPFYTADISSQDGIRWWETHWGRYSLPFGAAAIAVMVEAGWIAIFPTGSDFPATLLYLVPVLAVSWFGSYLPGVIACLLSTGVVPAVMAHGLNWERLDPTRVMLFLVLSLVVSLIGETQRKGRLVLRTENDELELRVKGRTIELAQAVKALESEVAHHRATELRLQIQLERLNLLDQITRGIGERRDLLSVFHVVLHSLEDHLPIDFGFIGTYDQFHQQVVVRSAGVRSGPLAYELGLTEEARIEIDQNGLSRCVGGQLVYEDDIREAKFPFPQKLASGGLRSAVIAPLTVESQVFGVLVAGRRESHAFSSADCEFLRQVGEHVALAAQQVEVHAALQQAYDDLRQSQNTVMQQERLRALGQMASGIAHDINNAISPVALYMEMLLEQEPNLSPRTREYLETTQRSIGDVAHTVARMREFYRQRDTELVLTAVDLGVLARQVIDLSRARWSDMPQRRGFVIEMEEDFAANLPTIAGIESEIREALTNVVFNAVDAMPAGGKLTLRTRPVEDEHGKSVELEIADTGVGMDEETRRRCLEPFYTTKGERGSGLGLAMVYGVMRRHNAELEIDSAQGRGTRMRMRFPVRTFDFNGAENPTANELPARLRILSVDDDPLLIKSLRDALEADGHVVVSAHGGQEGIDTFKAAEQSEEKFSLVITDLGMPYVDGRKVADAIKSNSPDTPVILLTGWGQRLVAEGDVPPHVDRVLNKPPKLRELRAALAELTSAAPVH